MLRLFFFVFHSHFLLFMGCLLLNVDISFSAALWVLSAMEVTCTILKFLTTTSLLALHHPLPPLLDLIELAMAIGFGGAMVVDFALDDSPLDARIDSLFGQDMINVLFLFVLLCLTMFREAVRLAWKHREGYWNKIHWARMFIILLIAFLDFLLGYYLLVPAVASLSFRLCDCNNTARGCDILDPELLCYLAVGMFYFVTFLSSLMVTAILWYVCSQRLCLKGWGTPPPACALAHVNTCTHASVHTPTHAHMHSCRPAYTPICTTDWTDCRQGGGEEPHLASLHHTALYHTGPHHTTPHHTATCSCAHDVYSVEVAQRRPDTSGSAQCSPMSCDRPVSASTRG